jgi:hypothetical protein
MERVETDAAQDRQAVAAGGIAQIDEGAAQQGGESSNSAVFEKFSPIDSSVAHRSPKCRDPDILATLCREYAI